MSKRDRTINQKKPKGTGMVLPALCNILGTLMLVAVIGLCLPLTVPKLLGYDVFNVVSGSMEPEIPVGSVVYVKDTALGEVQEGEIIAYQDGDSVVVHRVVTNRTSLGEFVTKGDANNTEDLRPIPYEAVIGKMEQHIPILGAFMSIYASTLGKVYLLLTAACGVMLNMVASRMREARRQKAAQAQYTAARAEEALYGGATHTRGNHRSDAYAFVGANAAGAENVPASSYGAEQADSKVGPAASSPFGPSADSQVGPAASSSFGPSVDTPAGPAVSSSARQLASEQASSQDNPPTSSRARSPKSRKSRILGILGYVLVCILATAFLGSAGVVGYTMWQYSISDALYSDAVDKYASVDGTNSEIAPIKIDFKDLCEKNPDVVGWIYCPDTVINYPVLHGKTNDQYLYRDYLGDYNMNGSIFVDADNAKGFVDANTIIYGHHMNSGSMFASLEEWGKQDYYDKHPVMWLLTPTQDYKIELFSAHHTDAYSSMYEILHNMDEKMAKFLTDARDQSDIKPNPGIQHDSQSRYVMLSTCAYLFSTDRYVVHGKLTPVPSAGGVAK